MLTRDPEADAISLATATGCCISNRGTETGAAQIEAATRPEQTALPITSGHGSLEDDDDSDVVLVVVILLRFPDVSGPILNASTPRFRRATERKVLMNLTEIFILLSVTPKSEGFDLERF